MTFGRLLEFRCYNREGDCRCQKGLKALVFAVEIHVHLLDVQENTSNSRRFTKTVGFRRGSCVLQMGGQFQFRPRGGSFFQ